MKKISQALVVLITVLINLYGCGTEEVKKEVIRPVKAIKVGDVETFTGRWFPGKAKASKVANLSFRVAGTIFQLPIKVGDQVKAGDLLAKLDPRDFEVSLNNAKAQLDRVQAAVDLAKTEYERVVKIRVQDSGAISQSMVDSRQGEYKSSLAQLRAAQAEVNRYKDSLGYSLLYAPFSGTVADTFVENYEDVQAKQEIVRIIDSSNIDFTIQVPENMMKYISKVHSALVVFDTFPDMEIPGVIKEIGTEASETTRTYPVTLSLEQPSIFKILPGMAGKARADRKSTTDISQQEMVGAIEIPVAAAFPCEDGMTCVWVVDEETKTVDRRPITTGDFTVNGMLATGVHKGEWVVTAGVNSIAQGQKVRIQE